jgi:hypothetical protein
LGKKLFLHILEILRVVSQAFQFARRMAKDSVLSGDALTLIDLRRIGGIGLYIPNEPDSPHAKNGKAGGELQAFIVRFGNRNSGTCLECRTGYLFAVRWKDADRESLKAQQPVFFNV